MVSQGRYLGQVKNRGNVKMFYFEVCDNISLYPIAINLTMSILKSIEKIDHREGNLDRLLFLSICFFIKTNCFFLINLGYGFHFCRIILWPSRGDCSYFYIMYNIKSIYLLLQRILCVVGGVSLFFKQIYIFIPRIMKLCIFWP